MKKNQQKDALNRAKRDLLTIEGLSTEEAIKFLAKQLVRLTFYLDTYSLSGCSPIPVTSVGNLSEVPTEELREELKRRAAEARKEASKSIDHTPKYVVVEGVVRKVRSIGPFYRWDWEVEISEDTIKELGLNSWERSRTYKLRNGVFKKDTAPKEGDIVQLRCRITKYAKKFHTSRALITEIVKHNGEVS